MTDKILLVDDDPVSIALMEGILHGVGTLRVASSGAQALQAARDDPPDLMLLDAEMPGLSGFQVCEAMKAEPLLAEVPVVFVTSHCEAEFEVAGFEAGASDFIAKPLNAPLVLARVRAQLRVKRMADALRRTAATDGLTGLASRRQFDEALRLEWLRARRNGDPLSLLWVDVDHLTRYNHHYGRPMGDECLRSVAKALLAASLRPADLAARVSGHAFALLLPQTPRAGAEHMAHRALDVVEALAIAHPGSSTARHVTVSIGIGSYDAQSACWLPAPSDTARHAAAESTPAWVAADLVRAADQALYAAKAAGRAQAKLLDIADVGDPGRARDIVPSARGAFRAERAARG